jgi:hypothetical protein
VHFAAFFSFENCPAGHAAHSRSDVVLGEDRMRSPATQTVCGWQKPLPASGWYVLGKHSSHAAAFSKAEKRPFAHASHALPLMNVPGLHVLQ